MATSNSTDFNQTRDEIIDDAAELLQDLRIGEVMRDAKRQKYARALNRLVKHWQGQQFHLWSVKQATLFPQPGQVQYQIGQGATDHVTETYLKSTLSAAASAGATVLDVEDTTDMLAGDNFGTVLDVGKVHWSTVVGAPTATQVTIATGLADSAGAGQFVYDYTTRIVRPLRIPEARAYDPVSDIDRPMRNIARLDYQELPQKRGTGAINQWYYDPQIPRGLIHLWQDITLPTELVNFTWWKPLQDFDNPGDNADLPQEWLDTLVWNLAEARIVTVSLPEKEARRIEARAASLLDDMRDWDREPEMIEFSMDMEQTGA